MIDFIILILAAIAVTQLTLLLLAQRGALTRKSRPIFIDTSVLMDGRITTIARTGFIGERLVVPRSVVAELQLLADNGDADKRSRARHGLDIIAELQKMPTLQVEILNDGSLGEGGVDTRLVELAKKQGGLLCTIDFNLNKVATVEKVFVLNVNELAQSLRLAFLPGERSTIKLTQRGNDTHQGVGYLPDGTMVVVEQASQHVGNNVEVEFIRALQTTAGRMMFAKVAKQKQQSPTPRPAGTRPTKTPVNERRGGRPNKPDGAEASKRPAHTSRRRRSTPEDSLVSLVNQQDNE